MTRYSVSANRGAKSAAPTVSWLVVLLLAFNPPALIAQAPVTIDDAWVRAAPPGAQMTAAYLTLRNATDQPVRVVGVESPQFASIEMHESMVHDGMAHMAPIEAIEVPAHGEVSLKPGGLHLMLMDATQPFAEGDKVILTLDFEDGWSIEFDATVRREAP